ncbi:YbaY family lipoprotein [Roseateles koreensis]|uniref:YbaY family lipoprotein n=1 Tax=Roseateles koreensis TaxID=2987526 RepID=A0ABT5KQY1_9BURK|nr:YbaY family lipoprotein [Roseateles koreensis]MDC8785262.1 YbaY family lipoprotein [Roseateles koreensis]
MSFLLLPLKNSGVRMRRRSLALLAACGFSVLLSSVQAAPEDKPQAATVTSEVADMFVIEGTASYRERIALPPAAVLHVSVLDVSLADAPAKVLAQIDRPLNGAQVPLPFNFKIPKAAVNAQHRYAVRATIDLDGKLLYTTMDHYGVLTREHDNQPRMQLHEVYPPYKKTTHRSKPAAVTADVVASLSLPGVQLPASFTGVYPCADCPGISQTLTLRPDGLYRMRSVYLGKPSAPFSQQGRWSTESNGRNGRTLVLHHEAGQQFLAIDRASRAGSGPEIELRQLDIHGQAIASKLNYVLKSTAQVDAIVEPLIWRGEVVYQADAAVFTDCQTGLRWPLLMTGDYAALEKSYVQQRSAPGAALMVRFEGSLSKVAGAADPDGAAREHLRVDRFIEVQAGQRCGVKAVMKMPAVEQSTPSGSDVSLVNTYWKLIAMDGESQPTGLHAMRDIQITLHTQDHRVSGFSGCNRLMGQYTLKDDSLVFAGLAGTRMACTPAAMAIENKVLALLGATTRFRVQGQQLTLLAGDQVLGRFVAVFLR